MHRVQVGGDLNRTNGRPAPLAQPFSLSGRATSDVSTTSGVGLQLDTQHMWFDSGEWLREPSRFSQS